MAVININSVLLVIVLTRVRNNSCSSLLNRRGIRLSHLLVEGRGRSNRCVDSNFCEGKSLAVVFDGCPSRGTSAVNLPSTAHSAVKRPSRGNSAVSRHLFDGFLSSGKSAVNRPSRVKGAVNRPSRAKGAVNRPSRVKGAVNRPSRVKGAVNRPSRGKGAVNRPPRDKSAVNRPSRGKRRQLKSTRRLSVKGQARRQPSSHNTRIINRGK